MTHCATVANMKPLDVPLTTQQAGQILNRSPQTVIRFARNGVLKATRLDTGPNGAYLFNRSDVEKLAKTMKRAKSQDGHPELGFDVDEKELDATGSLAS
jgi:excisionase family DNA binding protein